ncbi:MAG: TetR/AcrR family transcriptional regulator [Ilumatobacter sp.]|uniref:TetR/AcrR family transcriptional regulator n=1 Tax=Ilumatobacter sp. TaxID=1967498 RepID=UPI003299C403
MTDTAAARPVTEQTRGTEHSRGRPRSEAADQAILTATLRSLASVGFAGTTMSGIAREAGVSTATLYRRYDGIIAVVIDALASQSPDRPVPDTGSLRHDLALYLDRLTAFLASRRGGSLLSALLDEAGRNPELADALYVNISRPARDHLATVFLRAIERGEARGDLDVDLAIDMAVGPLYVRRLEAVRPFEPDLPVRLAHMVAAAVQSERPDSESP